MKEFRLVMSDDVVFAETRQRVEADGTHRLALDDEAVELDLTDAHYKELLSAVRRFLDAGHQPGVQPGIPGTPGSSRQGKQFQPGIIARNRALRAWADAQGIRNPRHPELPPYRSPAGTYKHPPWLVRQYEDYLAGLAGSGGMHRRT